jgi:peroxiredoxin
VNPGAKVILVALAIAGICAAVFTARRHPASNAASVAPVKGAFAPDFTLPQLDGHELRLSSYRGKVVLLDFWATWCAPCREETPHLVELQQKYADRGLQVIGVSMDDSPEPARAFYQQFHMNYPVVMGTAQTGELYGGVLGLPIAFLIKQDGRIYAKHIGATDAAVFEKDAQALVAHP